MPAFVDSLLANESLPLYIGLFSLVFFLVTLIAIPLLILQIPEDYFSPRARQPFVANRGHPVLRMVILVLKNLAGVIFLLLGIMLLLLPGQGLLTILLGVILIDFPGKYRLERWLISRGSILRSVNWLRKKGKRKPIKL